MCCRYSAGFAWRLAALRSKASPHASMRGTYAAAAPIPDTPEGADGPRLAAGTPPNMASAGMRASNEGEPA